MANAVGPVSDSDAITVGEFLRCPRGLPATFSMYMSVVLPSFAH